MRCDPEGDEDKEESQQKGRGLPVTMPSETGAALNFSYEGATATFVLACHRRRHVSMTFVTLPCGAETRTVGSTVAGVPWRVTLAL